MLGFGRRVLPLHPATLASNLNYKRVPSPPHGLVHTVSAFILWRYDNARSVPKKYC